MARSSKAVAVRATPHQRAVAKVADTAKAQTTEMVDGLLSMFTGQGGSADKMSGLSHAFVPLSVAQLNAAYRGNWMARKIVNIPAYDATREWRAWQTDGSQLDAIEGLERTLHIPRKVELALKKARLFGGGALVLGVDQGNPQDELIIDRVAKGQLKFVHAVSSNEITAGPIIGDLQNAYFGQPEYYDRTNARTGSTRIHPSRVVRFAPNEPLDETQQVSGGTWGDSVLQVVDDALKSSGLVNASIAQLVSEAKLDIVSIPGFTDNAVDKKYRARVERRFAESNIVKSVFGTLVIDGAEKWERIEQTFSGLDAIQQLFFLIVTGAADIPATRFFGQSPAGLSATGESDLRNYYDNVAHVQETDLTPSLTQLDEVLLRSAMGNVPDGLFYNWNSLWQLSDKERADIAKSKADTFKVDVDAGLINPAVLKKARENQLIEDGTYPAMQAAIDEFDDPNLITNQNLPTPANSNDPAGLAPDGTGDPTALDNPEARALATRKAQTTPAGQIRPRKRVAGARDRKVLAQSMADRIAGRIEDATTPRTLYIYRKVLNQADIKKWAKAQGFASSLDDMHVTIAYSRKPVDWLKVGTDWYASQDKDGKLIIPAGGPRVMERFNKATVLAFASTDLSHRHRSIHRNNYGDNDDEVMLQWDYEDYTPHITISYNDTRDVLSMPIYIGPIELGPEIFEEIKPAGFKPDDVAES